jgi:hypothetical protein
MSEATPRPRRTTQGVVWFVLATCTGVSVLALIIALTSRSDAARIPERAEAEQADWDRRLDELRHEQRELASRLIALESVLESLRTNSERRAEPARSDLQEDPPSLAVQRVSLERVEDAVRYVEERRASLDWLIDEFSENAAWDAKKRTIRDLSSRLAKEHGFDEEQSRKLTDALFELSLRKVGLDQKYAARSKGSDPTETASLKAEEWSRLRDWLDTRVFVIVQDSALARSISREAHESAASWAPVTRDGR